MVQKHEEAARKPGVCYAVGRDGIERPIIDVTHPAFALDVTDAEVRARVEAFLHEPQPFARLPPLLRDALLSFLLRGSKLAEGIRRASDTHLSAMGTYLLKLGPDNLIPPYATLIDRKIAASLPSFSMRLRLQDMARLLADALRPWLAASPARQIRILNIAGGAAADSVNALLLLRKEGLLGNHRFEIVVVDSDSEGPEFGMRALEALRACGAPLHGIDVALHHAPYNWNDPSRLGQLLGDRADVLVGSSEGGLFEYGTDDAIVSNLRHLRACTIDGFVMAGTVTRADEPMRQLRRMRRTAIRPRGIDAFRKLVSSAGWRLTKAIERPFSDHVVLAKNA
jgi:hypothetical protein